MDTLELFQSQIYQINIPSFSHSKEDYDIVLYNLEIKAFENEKKWNLQKRFADIFEFNSLLEEIYFNLPSLPSRTFLRPKEMEELNERRTSLEKYFQVQKDIAKRIEIVSSPIFQDFMKVKENYPLLITNAPKLQYIIENFRQTVRDFFFLSENRCFLILTAQQSAISRLDAYINSMRVPWEKAETSVNTNASNVPIGLLELWRFNEEGEPSKQWTKNYMSMGICFHYDTLTCMLTVGLDNGVIDFIKIAEQKDYLIDESFELPLHEDRVTGVFFDKKFKQIHSVSKDHKYIVTDIQQAIEISKFDLQEEILSLYFCLERQLSFLGTKIGRLTIYDCSSQKPIMINELFVIGAHSLNCIDLDNSLNYLFLSGYEGSMSVIDLGKYGKEKFAKQVASLVTKHGNRQLCWSNKRKEIFLGSQDGTITIFSAISGNSVYAFKAHQEFITKMKWDEDHNLLITSSREQDLKFWVLPNEWIKKEIEQREYVVRKSIVERSKSIQQLKLQENDLDDECDLDDWHKKN